MSRVKITFPASPPLFQTSVPVRIGDVNYGGHLGNDAVLSIIHEARMQALSSAGFTELDCGGAGLIMADAAIAYMAEAFYGEVLRIEVFAADIATQSFSFLYRVTKEAGGIQTAVAHARTGMVAFDYGHRRIAPVPTGLLSFLQSKILSP